MQRRLLLLATIGFTIALTGCDWEEIGDSNRYKEDFSYSYPLKPGGHLELETFNGSVDITTWTKDSVEITGTKYAGTPELLNEVRIDIVAAPDSVRIRTIRPRERRGNMGARYVLRVPARLALDRIASSNGGIRVTGTEGPARLATSNGAIRLTDVKGDLDAKTSNGGVELLGFDGSAVITTSNGSIKADNVRGYFEAHTSNASIEARLTGIDPARPIRADTSNGNVHLTLTELKGHQVSAQTSNGSITIQLPASAQAQVRAHTSNSSITTDFDVAVRGSLSKNHLEGTINGGGALLDLSTSNGHIRLLKM